MNSLRDPVSFLEKRSISDLRTCWQQHYGTPAPATMSLQLLRLAIAYRLQEAAHGGLSWGARLRLKAMDASSGKQALAQTATPSPKSGTKFIREWQGRVHEVQALEQGLFAYEGETHRSLTTIARLITGTHQSGPKFFGLNSN